MPFEEHPEYAFRLLTPEESRLKREEDRARDEALRTATTPTMEFPLDEVERQLRDALEADED